MNEAETHGNVNLPIGDIENTPNANQEIGEPIGDPDPNSGPSYWHSRGYLPHLESPEKIQHVTFHLADSLPKAVLERWAAELKRWPPDKQAVEQRQRVQAWLDAGHGSCVLRETEIAAMVQNSFLLFDGQRYRLHAWVVMPNHVHVLFQSLNGWTMAKIVASWKKFTARKICDYRRATGHANFPIGNGDPGDPNPVWHREYWDRYMRDERHFQRAVEYIHQNPVKAGLVGKAEAWPWSSTYPGTANLPIGRTDVDNANQAIGDPSDDPRRTP
jgi:REP element-mobilizing transposase RayT